MEYLGLAVLGVGVLGVAVLGTAVLQHQYEITLNTALAHAAPSHTAAQTPRSFSPALAHLSEHPNQQSQVHVAMAPARSDTLVWPCSAPLCSGPPCCIEGRKPSSTGNGNEKRVSMAMQGTHAHVHFTLAKALSRTNEPSNA